MKISVDLHTDPLMHLRLVCRHTGPARDVAISHAAQALHATRPAVRESGAFRFWSDRAGDADALVDSLRNKWI